jgi:hypothetical protein
MNDRITFEEDKEPEFYIDQDAITIIEHGIERKKLFPTSWFRLDIGIRSLETLELWDKIKDNPSLEGALEGYKNYIINLIIDKYKDDVVGQKSSDFKKVFYSLTNKQRERALKNMKRVIDRLKEMEQDLEE